jgi:hypothetical protein
MAPMRSWVNGVVEFQEGMGVGGRNVVGAELGTQNWNRRQKLGSGGLG